MLLVITCPTRYKKYDFFAYKQKLRNKMFFFLYSNVGASYLIPASNFFPVTVLFCVNYLAYVRFTV
jgi:hypothetical protein